MPTRWLKKTEQVLKRKLLEDSSDGMKGLASGNSNMLNNYKPTINIKNRDVFAASKAAANLISTNNSTIEPETTTNSDDQDEANRQNVLRLAVIGVKEGIAEGITKIVGKDITNPILWTTDGSNFKYIDEYQIHQLFTAITEGAERPEATNIRRNFVNIAGKISTGGRRKSPTSSAWQSLIQNCRVMECGYTATSGRSLSSPTQNGRHNKHVGQK